jgi:hypothetical protein
MDLSGATDLPATPVLPETTVDRLKRELLDLHVAELQHILNHIQKRRDDLLLIVSFVNNYFDMSPENFRLFKEWIQAEGIIDMDAMIREVLKDATANLSAPSDQSGAPRLEVLKEEEEMDVSLPAPRAGSSAAWAGNGE